MRWFRKRSKACSHECSRVLRAQNAGKVIRPLSEYREGATWNLLRTIEREGECWKWVGRRAVEPTCPTKKTYGMTTFGGYAIRAHHLAYILFVGSIPDGKDILHVCDNMACVRPSHLVPGTHQENMRQRNLRGRQAWGDRTGRSVLKPAQVQQIRFAQGSERAIAEHFGMSRRDIRSIRSGLGWRHLPWEKPNTEEMVILKPPRRPYSPSQIAAVVSADGTAREIAAALSISVDAVNNIRRKHNAPRRNRPKGWWKAPEVLSILRSKITIRQISERFGAPSSYAALIRKLAREYDPVNSASVSSS